jgi:hypothetical protein
MRRRAAILFVLLTLLFLSRDLALHAQTRATSPLWGDLVPGPHRVGFRVLKLRDATRYYPASAAARPADRGLPHVRF